MATSRRLAGHMNDNKKYDTPPNAATSATSSFLRPLRSLRRRRIILGLVAIWLIYLFVQHLPTDVTPVRERNDPRYGRPPPLSSNKPSNGKASGPAEIYNGPIRYHYLGASLRNVDYFESTRDNVLFVVSNPRASSLVITAACGMASHNNDTAVHVAILGRHGLALKDLLAVNGLSEAACPVYWHDGQPDYPQKSTDERMLRSVKAALNYIYQTFHFAAVFFNDKVDEDRFLHFGLESIVLELDLPMIPIPANRKESVPWVLTLSGAQLRQWDNTQIDLLIRVEPESAGSLIRLLRSIRDADYTGLVYPRIVIELPARADPIVLEQLKQFRWPPNTSAAESRLVIRRYIDSRQMTPALASIRTMESFYPTGNADSHVFLLSSQAELAPNFYQFLFFSALEFRYGSKLGLISSYTMGLTLELPSISPFGDSLLVPKANDISAPLLLWQVPASTATLYFSDKWAEMHDFMSRRLATDPNLSEAVADDPQLSSQYPSWVRLALELMQARNYYMFYPTSSGAVSSLVKIHRELDVGPEELGIDNLKQKNAHSTSKGNLKVEGSDLVVDGSIPGVKVENTMLSTSTFASVLGASITKHETEQLWPDYVDVPLFSLDSQKLNWGDIRTRATAYAQKFALSVGGCATTESLNKNIGRTVESLFCSSKES